MAKTTAAQKTKVLVRHQCGSCNDVFTGKICPTCGEKVNIFPINTDGISTDEVASAVGATHGLPLNLSRSPEFFDPDVEMETAVRRQMKDAIQEAQLDKAKTLAADQAAKRLRAEETLEATKQGFRPPEQGSQQQEDQSGFASMSPGIFLQALGGWDPEQREQFLNQLASNPMLALNLSMMMNPGKSGNMNQMGMMNPMAMMGGMMQPQAEQAPPVDAATMVTAMISGMQALKEMSGGDDGGSKQMERMLDKMDEMRRETEDLKLQLAESHNKPSESLTTEDIRRIVVESMSGATSGKMGLLNGLQEIHAVSDELIGLGIVQKPSAGVDPEQALKERQFDHEKKRDDLQDQRAYELQLKAEESLAAKANVQSEFMSGLFAASQEQHDEKADEKEPEKPIDVVRVDARQASVIS
jgi:predicted  nucleic acid-binding Zn-ribbon protein